MIVTDTTNRVYRLPPVKKRLPLPDLESDGLRIRPLNFEGLKPGQRHPFHLVKASLWPFIVSVWLPYVLVIFVYYLYPSYSTVLNCPFMKIIAVLAIILFFIIVGSWLKDIIIESTYQGNHTRAVQRGMRFGFILFIISEIIFFFGFFWSFFHSAFNPSIFIGATWPPLGIQTLDTWNIPFLNTCILLSSGIAVTASHYNLRREKWIAWYSKQHYFRSSVKFLRITLYYGCLFTFLQFYEYTHSTFNLSSGIFGTTFFIITGLHGFHVIVGTLLLILQGYRLICYHLIRRHHVGYEAAIWYWHFVDIVWLFVFSGLYIWNASLPTP